VKKRRDIRKTVLSTTSRRLLEFIFILNFLKEIFVIFGGFLPFLPFLPFFPFLIEAPDFRNFERPF
jgi:hypothetical protein